MQAPAINEAAKHHSGHVPAQPASPEAPARPTWVSNAQDPEAAIAKAEAAQKEETREANYQGLIGLYAGTDAATIRAALAEELAPKGFWQVIGRWFTGSKSGAVRITEELAMFPPRPGYLGYAGYVGFAHIQEATSYLKLSRIPDEIMEDPTLLARARAGIKEVARRLRETGELDVITEFKGGVAT